MLDRLRTWWYFLDDKPLLFTAVILSIIVIITVVYGLFIGVTISEFVDAFMYFL